MGPTAVKQIKTAGNIEVGCSSLKYVALQTRAICYQSGDDNVVVSPYHPHGGFFNVILSSNGVV